MLCLNERVYVSLKHKDDFEIVDMIVSGCYFIFFIFIFLYVMYERIKNSGL